MTRPDTLPATGTPGPRNPLALRIPPPLLLTVSAVAMWSIAYRWPRFWMPFPWRIELALGLAALGSLAIGMAVAAFLRSRTTVDPRHPERSTVLVTGGVFRISRNPMYLGLALWLAAWGAYLANALAWAVPPLFVAAVTWCRCGRRNGRCRRGSAMPTRATGAGCGAGSEAAGAPRAAPADAVRQPVGSGAMSPPCAGRAAAAALRWSRPISR